MHNLKINTNNIFGLNTFICSYHGFANSDFILTSYSIQEDIKENYIQFSEDYIHDNFDHEEYQKACINEFLDTYFQDLCIDEINDLLYTQISVDPWDEEIYSPKYYNFGGDSIDIYFNFADGDGVKIYKYVISKLDEFETFLKVCYSSYDGFISFLPNNLKDFKRLHKSDKETYREVILNFVFQSVCKPSDIDFCGYDLNGVGYTEFLNYDSFNAFITNLENGIFDPEDVDEATVKIHMFKLWDPIIKENYSTKSKDEIYNLIKENYTFDMYDDDDEIKEITEAINKGFESIENNILNLF